METYKDQHFTGERALFKKSDAVIENCLFDDGESPLKEGRDLKVDGCTFSYKYPLWYGKNHVVSNCKFNEMSRSGIWYTDNSRFINLDIIAPKEFRRCHDISLTKIFFHQAHETLFTCDHVTMKDIIAKEGDYFGKDSTDVVVDNLDLEGNYCFDGGKRIRVTNSKLMSKDAFWNCEDVYLENCEIEGEYFGWNSKNITMKNCKVKSHQGFCYIENLIMINCEIVESDLIFEYCKNVDVDIKNTLASVKNPISGTIRSSKIIELILDDPDININDLKFVFTSEESKD